MASNKTRAGGVGPRPRRRCRTRTDAPRGRRRPRPAARPPTARPASRRASVPNRGSWRSPFDAGRQAGEGSMPDDPDVAGRQLHRLADLFGVAGLDERRQHDGALTRLQAAQALLETPTLDAGHARRLVSLAEARRA